MDELDTFAELAERIAVVTSPYEQLYKYKGIEPTKFELGCARGRYDRAHLYEIGDPFDPNCAIAHWEKYRKKAIELGASVNELPAKTNYPFYDLIQLGKFCSARASGQKDKGTNTTRANKPQSTGRRQKYSDNVIKLAMALHDDEYAKSKDDKAARSETAKRYEFSNREAARRTVTRRMKTLR